MTTPLKAFLQLYNVVESTNIVDTPLCLYFNKHFKLWGHSTLEGLRRQTDLM